MNTLLPFLSTSCIVISAIFVAFGLADIKRRDLAAHQKKMVWGAVFAILFFIIYATRTIVVGNTAFGGPDSIRNLYFGFLVFHILLATSSAVMGITTLVLAFRKSFAKHRKIGPVTAFAWFFTAITGVTVYLLLYIIFEPGPTKSVFEVITNTH